MDQNYAEQNHKNMQIHFSLIFEIRKEYIIQNKTNIFLAGFYIGEPYIIPNVIKLNAHVH